MLAFVGSALVTSFMPAAAPSQPVSVRGMSSVVMSEPMMARRSVVGTFAAAAAAAPLAAFADGASSRTVIERARVLYGSRVARLQDATAATIVEEKNVFTLFISGAYRSAADKTTKAELTKLSKTALAAAKAGDAAGAQKAVKEFVKVGDIKILDTVDGSIYNPKQRRNPGAPKTEDIEAQMGTQKFALYQPLK